MGGIMDSCPVVVRRARQLDLWLVGCGGTGSWLAPHIARLALAARERWQKVRVVFCDPDVVEPGNIPRQNFAPCEVGVPKALALAARCAAFGLAVEVVIERFDHKATAFLPSDITTVLVGCVDNAQARRQLHRALSRGKPPSVWWIDAGNRLARSGQVLVGSASRPEDLAGAFDLPGRCAALPSPLLQHPELGEPESGGLGCGQGLAINVFMAALAQTALTKLLLGELRWFAAYADLGAGLVRVRYTAPGEVAEAAGCDEEVFDGQPA